MATTTTNFGWDIPQSTDLVKDGATAIAALGQDIDTALVDLKGGTTGQVLAKATNTDLDFTWVAQDDSNAIQNAIVDAKGDLISATAADTPARLAVGTNDQVLTVDSSTATGLKWATPASGGMTLLSTTTLSGGTTTISSISGAYNQLEIQIIDWYSSSAGTLTMRFNSDTTSGNYVYNIINYPVDAGSGVTRSTYCYSTTAIGLTDSTTRNVDTNAVTCITLPNYADSTARKAVSFVSGYQNNGANQTLDSGNGWWNNVAAITSVSIITSAGTWSQGTVKIWGIK